MQMRDARVIDSMKRNSVIQAGPNDLMFRERESRLTRRWWAWMDFRAPSCSPRHQVEVMSEMNAITRNVYQEGVLWLDIAPNRRRSDNAPIDRREGREIILKNVMRMAGEIIAMHAVDMATITVCATPPSRRA